MCSLVKDEFMFHMSICVTVVPQQDRGWMCFEVFVGRGSKGKGRQEHKWVHSKQGYLVYT